MDKEKDLRYRFEKRARRKTGYPLATLAYYGPNDKFASKVAVGILLSEHDIEATHLERFFNDELDVRMDMAIFEKIVQFLELHAIHRIAIAENIIGCPHEEGVDYPVGEVCPKCPYWVNRDRWTGELLAPRDEPPAQNEAGASL